jgi:hypothetical protein
MFVKSAGSAAGADHGRKRWPAADGSNGITSAKAMDDAEAAGRAIEVGLNFFLFFSSLLASHAGH